MVNPAGKLMPWLAPLYDFLSEVDRVVEKRSNAAYDAKLKNFLKAKGVKVDSGKSALDLWLVMNNALIGLRESANSDLRDIAGEISGKLDKQKFDAFGREFMRDTRRLQVMSGVLTQTYRGNGPVTKEAATATKATLTPNFDTCFDSTNNFMSDFDGAPATERLFFIERVAMASSVLQTHSPEFSAEKKVRAVSSGSLLQDALTVAHPGSIFGKTKLALLADELPVTITNGEYAATTSAHRADILMPSLSSVPLTNKQIGDLTIKVLTSLIAMTTALVESQDDPATAACTRALFNRLSGGTGFTTPTTVEAAKQTFRARVVDPNDDMSKALKSAFGATLDKMQKLAKVLGFFGNISSLSDSSTRNWADLTKNIMALSKDIIEVVDSAAVARHGALKEAGFEFAETAGVKLAKTSAFALGTVICVIEVIAAIKGYRAASLSGDWSVAVGQVLVGAGALGAAGVTAWLYFAGASAAAGPAGIALAIFIGIGLIGSLLVSLTTDSAISNLAHKTIFGNAPSSSDVQTDDSYKFGPSGLGNVYANADLEQQLLAFRSMTSPIQFSVTSSSHIATQIAHTLKDADDNPAAGVPVIQNYPDWKIDINVWKSGTDEVAPLPKYAGTNQQTTFWNTGALSMSGKNKTLAQLLADSNLMITSPIDYGIFEFIFRSPADATGKSHVFLRKFEAY
ncbi:MAG: hypothetical protein HWD84_09935 [Flavobacteriaceae bacterium]|nr:hypothetical protein [Flavobacteriaceae bacterium]